MPERTGTHGKGRFRPSKCGLSRRDGLGILAQRLRFGGGRRQVVRPAVCAGVNPVNIAFGLAGEVWGVHCSRAPLPAVDEASLAPDPRRSRAVALSSGPRLKASRAPLGAAPPGSRTRWSASDGEARRWTAPEPLRNRPQGPRGQACGGRDAAHRERVRRPMGSILAARLACPRPARTSARAARASASAAAALDSP